MKLLNISQSVELDDTFSKNTANHSVDTNNAEQENIETKRPNIFDDDFQGIEWPLSKPKWDPYSLDITDLRNLMNPMNPLNSKSMFDDD